MEATYPTSYSEYLSFFGALKLPTKNKKPSQGKDFALRRL
jgi:hypothetical protein